MGQDEIHCLFGSIPRHTFIGILTYQIAILACQLAVFGHNERYILTSAIFPLGTSTRHLSMLKTSACPNAATPAAFATSHGHIILLKRLFLFFLHLTLGRVETFNSFEPFFLVK